MKNELDKLISNCDDESDGPNWSVPLFCDGKVHSWMVIYDMDLYLVTHHDQKYYKLVELT